MARRAVEVKLADVRSEDLRIALTSKVMGDEVLQFLPHDGAAGRPQDEPLTHLLIDVKELQVFAQFSMVPLLRFLQSG